jgi:hypothetical protein
MEPAPEHETTAHGLDDAVDVPIETPADDAAEQALPASSADDEDDDDAAADALVDRGLEVDEADAADQARSVGLDDEYR